MYQIERLILQSLDTEIEKNKRAQAWCRRILLPGSILPSFIVGGVSVILSRPEGTSSAIVITCVGTVITAFVSYIRDKKLNEEYFNLIDEKVRTEVEFTNLGYPLKGNLN